jgi:hypothetical protein
VGEVKHHTGRSPMALFNTQILIRRQEPAEREVSSHTLACGPSNRLYPRR